MERGRDRRSENLRAKAMMNDHHETKSRIGPILKHHEVETGIG